MVICTMIRILDGIAERMIDMKKLENAQTAVSAIDITRLTCSDDVTAKAEQIPSICNAIGLF